MDIQSILAAILNFITNSIIPFLMGVAFLVFLWNVVRFFIIGGANPDSQEKAKSLALWGIIAFFVITAIWGIVNLFSNMFDIGGVDPIEPDYLELRGTGSAPASDEPCGSC